MVRHDEADTSARGRLRRLLASSRSPLRFDGRLGRTDFFVLIAAWHLLSLMAFSVALAIVLIPLSLVGGDAMLGAAALGVGAVAVVAYVVGAASYGARRLHDMERSPRWLLVGLVPVVGLGLFFVLLTVAGTPGRNAYGEREGAPLLQTRFASGALPAMLSAEAAANTEAAFEEGRRFAERDGSQRPPPRLP